MTTNSIKPIQTIYLHDYTIYHYDLVCSTMDIARKLFENDCPHKTVVFANSQSNGKGRLNRSWTSQQGGIYFTVIMRPSLSIEKCFKFNFTASLAIINMLKKLCNINAFVKWPNDVLCNGKKIAGILSDMSAEGTVVHYLNIGIGINHMNILPLTCAIPATSIQLECHQSFPPQTLLSAFLGEFETLNHSIDQETILDTWKQHSCTMNQRVRIETTHSVFEGIAENIDSSGALVIRMDNDQLKHIVYGDCFHSYR